MTIRDIDIKLLWGRAAGLCSNPTCDQDLTRILADRGYVVGEMAHVIARSKKGPRGLEDGEANDTYENLLLLCPTCHTEIDKAPAGTFPVDLLLKWKSDHEAKIRSRGSTEIFEQVGALKSRVGRILLENQKIHREFGPKSEAAIVN